MRQVDLETVYEALAEGIDAVGPAQAEVFLARIVLGLAEDIGQTGPVLELIRDSRENLIG